MFVYKISFSFWTNQNFSDLISVSSCIVVKRFKLVFETILIFIPCRHGHYECRGSGYKVGMREDETPAASYREQDLQDDAGWR